MHALENNNILKFFAWYAVVVLLALQGCALVPCLCEVCAMQTYTDIKRCQPYNMPAMTGGKHTSTSWVLTIKQGQSRKS